MLLLVKNWEYDNGGGGTMKGEGMCGKKLRTEEVSWSARVTMGKVENGGDELESKGSVEKV
mgnify:CR=1 FL=1